MPVSAQHRAGAQETLTWLVSTQEVRRAGQGGGTPVPQPQGKPPPTPQEALRVPHSVSSAGCPFLPEGVSWQGTKEESAEHMHLALH